ncbi:ester cyclase [Bordetella genomosp. 9]|uniref:Ester cyclase n=1 Tax=Bordetella genomosp. 9 TaxID=1416803 RepID=A0A261R3J1_9BORD|nr:ester cyclase [Bordetella genomosp. 9]OZI19212.1 ester cyclase [Bordetella genomosp. 9]
MTKNELEARYTDYIACLNRQDWTSLGRYVHDDVWHNGRPLGLPGYRAMLEKDLEQIPDLRFHIEMLLVDPPRVACRLRFDVTPKAVFMGLPVNGRRVSFREHAFYEFRDGRIFDVRSVIDKAAIEAQL